MEADEIAAGRRRFDERWAAPAGASDRRTTLSGLAARSRSTRPTTSAHGRPPGFERIGWPGEYPFTRGIHTTGYLGKPWTVRQFAGFGAADDTNARFHQLLDGGSDGLSVAFDMPTLMGLDSDDPRAHGEVGHCGVAVDSAQDMERLLREIPLDAVTTSMTISGPAVPLFCTYVVAAERAGDRPAELGGTLQTDIFKEYIAQKEWIFPPEPHLRLIGDLMEWTQQHMPRYHPISISGYHIREAGATAAQELAFTLADGFGYVELGLARGLAVDDFAPRLSFFFDAHIDFFEEIAKFRAARRIWARWMRDRYGATTDQRAVAALPHPDGRGLAHRAAAGEQRGAHRGRGAGRGARRHQLVAHQRAGRGARAPDRGGGGGGTSDAAGAARGDRGRVGDRPTRWLVVRRGVHRPGRGGGRSRSSPRSRVSATTGP